MKRPFLNFVLFVTVCLVGVSFARGWVSMTKPHETTNRKVQLELTVDPARAEADAAKVGEAVKEISRDVIQRVENKGGHPAESANGDIE